MGGFTRGGAVNPTKAGVREMQADGRALAAEQQAAQPVASDSGNREEAESKAAKRRARRGRGGGPGLLSSASLGGDSSTLGSVR